MKPSSPAGAMALTLRTTAVAFGGIPTPLGEVLVILKPWAVPAGIWAAGKVVPLAWTPMPAMVSMMRLGAPSGW